MHVLGRDASATGPAVRFGTYRAADGSDGAAVGLDLHRPHAALVVGKRGYGKSHTLGVVAEGAARAPGVAPIVVDPMGEFAGLAEGSASVRVVAAPTVAATLLPSTAWPALFDLSPTDSVGALLWEAARETATLDEMLAHVDAAAVADGVARAARNHLQLADSWGVFDPDGLDARTLLSASATVLDCSGLADRAAAALVRAVAAGLYDACVDRRPERLPWLLLDEAHVFFDGIAAPALETVLTRGRTPGVSLVAATQRPGALPSVALSQSDLLIAHRLTAGTDVEALAAATPTYLSGRLRDRLPAETGAAVVVDDVTESVHGVQVRARETPHGGADPRVDAAHDDSSMAVPQSGHSPSTTGTGVEHSGQNSR
ncbi:hypothetical protein SAMN04488065_2408 [Haloplanus vescus]|uniref:Helicase HerA central domain-containing protein n=1 Tax=Haloplanus vescus TaxID=555874 RepID=A0A1H3ZL74_9EURY|nr:DUF87 domain-containing protein [Haloplanus vescus]SEA24044.1 hypothetical protein SAMN04488065_2408 [Haloplanus vescus]